jgi:hypothetical protein
MSEQALSPMKLGLDPRREFIIEEVNDVGKKTPLGPSQEKLEYKFTLRPFESQLDYQKHSEYTQTQRNQLSIQDV